MRRVVLLLVAIVAVLLLAVLASVTWTDGDGQTDEPVGEESARVDPGDVVSPTPVEGSERRERRPRDTDDSSGRSLSVRVIDESGTALEGVLVTAGVGDDLRPLYSAVTDPSGTADLGAVAAEHLPNGGGELEVTVFDDIRSRGVVRSIVVQARSGPVTATVRLPTELVPVMVVRLRPTEPRPGALRFVREPAPIELGVRVTAGRDVFRLRLPPPRPDAATYRTVCPGFEDARVQVEFPDEPGDFVVEVPLRRSDAPIFGTVLGLDGAPVAGVRVAAWHRDHTRWACAPVRTDDRGRFPLDVDMFGHDLRARVQWTSCSDWTPVTRESSEVTLRMDVGGRITGSVRDGDGRPIAGHEVLWSVCMGPGERFRSDDDLSVVTDDAGRFAIQGIAPGWGARLRSDETQEVEFPDDAARAERLATAASEWEREIIEEGGFVARHHGDTLRADLVVHRRPHGFARLRFVLPDGVSGPLREARVYDPVESPAFLSATFLDEDNFEGSIALVPYALGAQPSATVRVVAGPAPGHMLRGTIEPFDVVADEITEVVVPLRRAPRLVVQLTDEDGRPLALDGIEVGVTASNFSSPLVDATTDPAGRADLSELSVGHLEGVAREGRDLAVEVVGPRRLDHGAFEALTFGPDELQGLILGDGEEVVIRLRRRPPVRRTLLAIDDDTGEPIAGLPLLVGFEDVYDAPRRDRIDLPVSSLIPPRWVTTDADGRADFLLFARDYDREDSPLRIDGRIDRSRPSDIRTEPPHVARWSHERSDDENAPWIVRFVRRVERVFVLTDEQGRPLPGLDVGHETTDAHGRITRRLGIDTTEITLHPEGYPDRVVPISSGDDPVEVHLPTPHHVVLHLTVPDGAPRSLSIAIHDAQGREVDQDSVTADPSGEAVLRLAVPRGGFEIWARTNPLPRGRLIRRHHARTPVAVAYAPGSDATDRIDLTLVRATRRPVTWHFLDTGGGPVEADAVAVTLTGYERDDRHVELTPKRTFEASLEPGRYHLEATLLIRAADGHHVRHADRVPVDFVVPPGDAPLPVVELRQP